MAKPERKSRRNADSLLNECKGNLFEFLVAQFLSQKMGNENIFLLNFPNEFKKKLQSYEETIRAHDRNLLSQLSPWAHLTAEKILEHPTFKGKEGYSFSVIGKLVKPNSNEFWNETDIVATKNSSEEKKEKYYLSLKLSKEGIFTNTKSAGIKSFLSKYFKKLTPQSINFQEELNSFVDHSFLIMGHALYKAIDQDFKGKFDSRWTNVHPELPGELDPSLKKIVHANYFRVTQKMHEYLIKLQKVDGQKFYHSLHALCGFSDPSILQINCFHGQSEITEICMKTKEDFFSNDWQEAVIKNLSIDSGSFEISFKKFVLQIRVKPMNKFTTPSYKINCSTKMKGEK